MKKINTANPSMCSKNVYERFAASFLDIDSIKSIRNRYRTFYAMAKKLREGNTFIADSFSTINGSTLSYYVHELNDRYKCDFIKIITHGGKIVRNEQGMIVAKSSCNIYQFNADPNELLEVLDDVRECIMRKFEM